MIMTIFVFYTDDLKNNKQTNNNILNHGTTGKTGLQIRCENGGQNSEWWSRTFSNWNKNLEAY